MSETTSRAGADLGFLFPPSQNPRTTGRGLTRCSVEEQRPACLSFKTWESQQQSTAGEWRVKGRLVWSGSALFTWAFCVCVYVCGHGGFVTGSHMGAPNLTFLLIFLCLTGVNRPHGKKTSRILPPEWPLSEPVEGKTRKKDHPRRRMYQMYLDVGTRLHA